MVKITVEAKNYTITIGHPDGHRMRDYKPSIQFHDDYFEDVGNATIMLKEIEKLLGNHIWEAAEERIEMPSGERLERCVMQE